MSAAFGTVRDPIAWVVRGLVEAGLPELTPGAGDAGPWGGWEIDGGGNVALRIHALDWDDERAYAVVRAPGADGRLEVLVHCRDAMFRNGFQEFPLETLGARILAHVRHHDAAFSAWRAQGGQLGPAERASIGEVRGTLPPDGDFLRFVQWLRAQSAGLGWGPHAGWWPVAAPTGPAPVGTPPGARGAGTPGSAGFGGITAGRGADPSYRLRPAEVDFPQNRAYAAQARKVGQVLLVAGILAALIGLGALGFVTRGRPFFAAFSARPMLCGLAAMSIVQAIALGVAGQGMRGLRRLDITRWLAIAGAIPMSFAGFLVFPAGAYGWWVLRDDRARVVFEP